MLTNGLGRTYLGKRAWVKQGPGLGSRTLDWVDSACNGVQINESCGCRHHSAADEVLPTALWPMAARHCTQRTAGWHAGGAGAA